jgi:hypothetical protein
VKPFENGHFDDRDRSITLSWVVSSGGFGAGDFEPCVLLPLCVRFKDEPSPSTDTVLLTVWVLLCH